MEGVKAYHRIISRQHSGIAWQSRPNALTVSIRHKAHIGVVMGIFGGIKNTYKKSEAAAVVQNLLEHQASVGLFSLDPAKLATKLTGAVWDSKPDVFNGKFGQRPHKITVAASALASGIGLFDVSDLNRNALVLSLGNLLSELETNGRLYPLNSLDHQLLEASISTFTEIVEEFSES